MSNNRDYMAGVQKKLNARSNQIAQDKATIANNSGGNGKMHTAGAPDDDFSEAVERDYARSNGEPPYDGNSTPLFKDNGR